MSSRAAILTYTGLSIVLTWPLALGLASDVPGDLGDSLLNMWILAWGAEHVPRLVTGAVSWQAFWNANIFHPEPLALTFSEHLFGQTLQILPIYWLTGNVILCYNLLFISTFALSAFGTYLLVRDLTGNRTAAFVAGLVYGFLPYRIASVPHLQVMSSQWMPFALYGLNRFVTGSPESSRAKADSLLALAGGTAALVMQNWSCGYYLLYFVPFVPLFVMHRMWTLGKLKAWRMWLSLAAAAAVTLLLTLPFLFPYLEAQQRFGFERSFGEVVLFSANVWSYITASENLTFWGKALRYYPHSEGETFLGFVPWLLAIVALVAACRGLTPRENSARGLHPTTQSPRGGGPGLTPSRKIVTVLLTIAVITQFFALMSVVTFGGFDLTVLGLMISARTPQRLLMQFVVAAVLLLVISPATRGAAARLVRTPLFFFAAATVLAMWLSLGPLPKAGDARVSGFGLYGVLYDNVPGFNGVRVPARYAMLAGLFLAVLAGFGTAELLRGLPALSERGNAVRNRGDARVEGPALSERGDAISSDARVEGTPSRLLLAVLGALILIEGAAIPMEINRTWAQNEAEPPARLFPASSLGRRSLGGGDAPPVYARVASLPGGSAITEFPFGDAAWEIRYVYYSHAHWKPITNGYSGAFPPSYKARVARWRKVDADPEAAWRMLLDSGTTHVVLHPNAFVNPADAATVDTWLRTHGARELERFPDGDILFELKTELRTET